MQWRRIVLSFVIVFGATLWALPFSVFASDFCVSEIAPIGASDCPTGSSLVPNTCLPGHVGAVPEHTCSSSANPCLSSSGGSCTGGTSCGAGTFKINDCPNASTCPNWCVSQSTFATAVATATATCTATPTAPGCAVTPPTGSTVTTTVKNPLAFSTVEGVLGSVLSTLQAIIVVLALISIVIGGILYITSAGNDERMKTAKGAITAAAIGLALGLAAPSFLKQISTILGWTATVDCTGKTGADLTTCQSALATLNAGKPLSAIALSALQFLLSIVGVLGIIMLVIGGLTYLTSAGDEERSESGKKIVTYAIIGIAVALASLIAVTQIAGLFV